MSTYERGSIFLENKRFFYMIVRSGSEDGNLHHFSCLTSGNVWSESVLVGNYERITEDEITEMAGISGNFTFFCGPIKLTPADVSRVEPKDWHDTVKEQITANRKVSAIKIYRDNTGESLRHSKDTVEQWGRDMGVWT